MDTVRPQFPKGVDQAAELEPLQIFMHRERQSTPIHTILRGVHHALWFVKNTERFYGRWCGAWKLAAKRGPLVHLKALRASVSPSASGEVQVNGDGNNNCSPNSDNGGSNNGSFFKFFPLPSRDFTW